MPPPAALTKLLRSDLRRRGEDSAPPRVMAFVHDDDTAQVVTNPLRNALWEEHRIGLVVPDGAAPTQTLHVRRPLCPRGCFHVTCTPYLGVLCDAVHARCPLPCE